MGLFDNMYGFNPNTIQTPAYPQARITTTPNPPLINPISSPTELPMVNGYESAMRYRCNQTAELRYLMLTMT